MLLLVVPFWKFNEIWYHKAWLNIHLQQYRIRSNYRTYPYKRTVKQFHCLQITASVLFVYFIKAYVVGTYLNCIDLSMQFKWVPTTYAFIKKIRRKKSHNHHQISLSSDLYYCVSLVGRFCLFDLGLTSLSTFFSHIATVSGCGRELNAHF